MLNLEVLLIQRSLFEVDTTALRWFSSMSVPPCCSGDSTRVPLGYTSDLSALNLCLFSYQLLDEPQFRCITKIKTIGSTYMAASGVTVDVNDYSCMKVTCVVSNVKLVQGHFLSSRVSIRTFCFDRGTSSLTKRDGSTWRTWQTLLWP